MAVTLKTLIEAAYLANSQTTQYTSTAAKTRVDKFTVTNVTASNVTFALNAVPSGGSASDANIIIKGKSIAPNETYNCPEIVGHILEAGAFLSTLAGTATALSCRATGTVIT